MRIRIIHPVFFVTLAFCFGLSLIAQPNPPPRPRVGDLREEQRLIDNAYLGDADFQIGEALKRLGGSNNRLAQQSGLWALEQVAYAKRRLERHAPKIEEAGGVILERASESTREELRKSYAKVREKYVNVEVRLEALAESLTKVGLPILGKTLTNMRNRKGDDAVKAVNDGFKEAEVGAKGDTVGGETIKEGTGATIPGGNSSRTIPGIPGSTVTQAGSGVSLSLPGKGSLPTIPGTVSADGRYIDSPEFGRIDLTTMRTLPDGTVVAQSDKGVVYLGSDGKWHLVGEAKLNGDGTVTGANGRTGPLTSLIGGGAQGGSFTGATPSGVGAVDQNGKRITVGPDWKNGEQTGVSKDYIDVTGGMLDSEIKVVRKIIDSSSNPWKIQETNGERRNWNFAIRVGEEKKVVGSISFLLTVDGGGAGGFTIRSWEVVDANGGRAAVAPVAGKPEATATFSKGGKYDSFAIGETDWGTPFRIKGPVIDAYP